MKSKLAGLLLASTILTLVAVSIPFAQLPAMGPPIPTTIVVTKPTVWPEHGDKPIITIGVGNKIYRFILKDGYTNHRLVRWPDIWEHVQQSTPNFQAMGLDEDQFAKIQPGETVTINGMVAPLDRTFEVMSVEHNTEHHL